MKARRLGARVGICVALALCLLSGGWAAADDSATPRFDEEPIYGEELMSAEERTQFRVQLREARDGGERRRLRGRHRRAMQERAEEQGVDLPVFGERYLTDEERTGYREQMRNAKTDRERIDIRNHRKTLISERLEADRKAWRASGKSAQGGTGKAGKGPQEAVRDQKRERRREHHPEHSQGTDGAASESD